MNTETLIAVNVGLPLASAAAAFIFNDKKVRGGIVAVTALALIASSLLLFNGGGAELSPGHIYETAVVVLDFALLAYFLYQGYLYRSWQVLALSVAQLVPAAYFEFVVKGTHVENIIVVDNLSILLTLIVNIVGSVVMIYATGYMEEHEHHLHLDKSRQNRFFFYMLLLLGAMNGMVYSNSLYWLYFFWEVTTLCCYELIRHDTTAEAQSNAELALWMGLVGGVAFVAAMFVGYDAVHSIALTDLMAAPLSTGLLTVFALAALAAFTKSAQFPFHGWLLGAMVAPTPVSALLHSSTMVNAGVYMLLRMAPAIQGTRLTYVIAFMGAVTFTVTAVLAIRQRVSKRILAFSTIGNLGLIILCVGLNTGLSVGAALTLLTFHSVAKGLLFMGAGVVENKLGSRDVDDWEGLLGRMPLTAMVMIAGMVSMFLPPFGMLLGKWVAVDAVASTPLLYGLPLVFLVVLGSGATTFYYAKWLGYLTVLPNGAKRSQEKLETPYKVALYTLLGVNVLISLGAALVVTHIVNPITAMSYAPQMSTPMGGVDLGFTSFPVLPLWAAGAAVLLIGSWLARSKGGVIATPYLSGENVADKEVTFMTTADSEVAATVSGAYLTSSIDEAWLDRLAVYLGTAIIVVLFIAEAI
ncbi:NADH-quinone oxidoreductase subunit L [Candidatus Bathyarchaeota archaeon]|nr:NADH-quinone oxidoreductase subunit L [Candidatus Bathyarchaeota archaeon]